MDQVRFGKIPYSCQMIENAIVTHMNTRHRFFAVWILGIVFFLGQGKVIGQDLPPRYLTMELFTNTPCPICGSQNPGLFSRLTNYEGQYHLISFYPGKPYSSCIFYQANIPENTARYQFYTGHIFGSPTVALNGIDFKSSSGVTNNVLASLTGGTSWLHVGVTESEGTSRTVNITLEDVVGGSLPTGRLFAVIVEKEVMYNAPNGETIHRNVFRKFLTPSAGEEIDLTSGSANRTYQYDVDGNWNAQETYVIAWLSNPSTNEIYNSGTRYDPDFVSSVASATSALPLTIYPNPASSQVFIPVPEGGPKGPLYLLDQKGSVIRTISTITEGLVTVPLTDLSSGTYVVYWPADHRTYSGTFQVVK